MHIHNAVTSESLLSLKSTQSRPHMVQTLRQINKIGGNFNRKQIDTKLHQKDHLVEDLFNHTCCLSQILTIAGVTNLNNAVAAA